MIGSFRHHLALALVSAGLLLFEVGLTRFLALAYWHHFAGLLIALALTGFGAAGSLAALLAPRLERPREDLLALAALAGGAAALAAPHLVLAIGLEPLALAWDWRPWLQVSLVGLILVTPFLLAAGQVALALAWSERPAVTYAWNLAGSGAGALASWPALEWLLPGQALVLAGGVVLAGGAVQALGLANFRRAVIIPVMAGLTGLAWLGSPPLAVAPFRDRTAALAAQGGRLVHQQTGVRGVVEAVGGPAFHYAPGLSLACPAPLPEQLGLCLDGDLLGPVTRLEASQGWPAFLDWLLAGLPHRLLLPRRVLLVGLGGGLGPLLALASGAERVVVVEENPQVAEALAGPLAEFSGRLLARPGVELVRADPAAYVAAGGERFDLVALGQGEAWEAGPAGGLGVTRLLTVAGLSDLLARLGPLGVLALTGPLETPPRASLKLLATAGAALDRLGRPVGPSLAVLRDFRTVLIILRPAGWSPAALAGLRALAARRGFDLAWLPDLEPEELNRFHHLAGEPIHRAAALVAAGRNAELLAGSAFDLRPASLDRPYFFHFIQPRTLAQLLRQPLGRGLAATEWGVLFTWAGLVGAVLIAAAGGLGPLARIRPRPPGLTYFGLLGLGYMLAEISLLQEALLRLGHPALAMPAVVGLFLLCSGLGSLTLGRFRPVPLTLGAAAALPLALLGLRHLPGPLGPAALAPAAFVLGGPLAAGLNHLLGPHPAGRAWAWGLNGFLSVVGSLAAALVCLEAGHMAGILSAAGCYLLAALTGRRG